MDKFAACLTEYGMNPFPGASEFLRLSPIT